ncbi:hypothetical protein, partial [Paraclostridium sordellii]|uniref:hypothetical protein n=1 Tax=Paraclostridium sordellii TaxID=1505 RepID=UPI0019D5CE1B
EAAQCCEAARRKNRRAAPRGEVRLRRFALRASLAYRTRFARLFRHSLRSSARLRRAGVLYFHFLVNGVQKTKQLNEGIEKRRSELELLTGLWEQLGQNMDEPYMNTSYFAHARQKAQTLRNYDYASSSPFLCMLLDQ